MTGAPVVDAPVIDGPVLDTHLPDPSVTVDSLDSIHTNAQR